MRTLSMLHKLIQVGLALVLMAIAPLSVAPAQAEEEDFFGAWVEFCSPDTGLVVINGVDTRQPEEPFTFDWGDGSSELSWFAGRHTYADTSQSYTVTIESVLGGESTVEVDFSQCPALEIQAWIDEINHESGFVVINGFIRGDPLVQVDWGDGSQPDESFFPVSHTYADTGQEYQVTITGTYHDGSLATFTLSITFTPPEFQDYGIYTFNADTRAVTLVTKNLPDTDEFNPAWSPNGRQIAHDVVVQGISHGIYITDVKTGISVPLKGAQDGGNNAAWSPNGKWIAFDRVPAGDPSLYLVPSAGGTPKLIRSDAINADWAPSGKRLVFQQPSDGSIRTIAVDGGKGAETLIAAQGASPVWSPDGRWIAYEYEGDIWKVQVNDQGKALGAPMRVTNNPFPEGHPTWTPDSKNIVFHADMGTGFDLWRISATGGTPVRLAGAPDAGDYDPACAPKGRIVAYGSPSRR